MKRFSLAAILISAISVSAFAFSEKDIISPASGVWCNQQALVLSPYNASEIYYSLTGSDPFESGFAYDGPVLIEKKGDVCVRIGIVEADGIKKEYKIDYSVLPAMVSGLDSEVRDFAEKNLVQSPLITYRSGSEFSFPQGIRYSFTQSKIPSLRQKLKLNASNSIERFVSFFVTDGINNYHSVIRVVPAEKKSVAKTVEYPFSIRSWNYFSWTDKKFIYQIDDEMWNSDYSERFIDRTVEHTIHWQSVDFSSDNRVFEFILPVISEVEAKAYGDGVTAFILSGDENYTFENGERILYADAFSGEETEGVCAPGIYLNGNLNGVVKVDYELDRLAPTEPVFAASGNSNFSRNTMALKIKASELSEIFYAVSEPVYYEEENEILSDAELKIEIPEDFIKYDGSDIIIKSADSRPCVYKVFAYAVDRHGNASKMVEQKYVIDELNFYVSAASASHKADGSFMNPFVSLEQAVEAINSSDSETRLHLNGELVVEGGELTIKKNCVLHGNGGKIIFKNNAGLVIDGAEVQIDSCSIEKQDGENSSLLLKINNGKISFNDCEISGFYKEDGKLFEAVASDINFKDCGWTIEANRISQCGDVEGGTFTASGCRWTSIGQSAVALKLKNTESSFDGSLFTLIGSICKGIEISGGSVSFAADAFNATSDGKYKNSGAVFRNGGCKVTGLNTTRTSGF